MIPPLLDQEGRPKRRGRYLLIVGFVLAVALIVFLLVR